MGLIPVPLLGEASRGIDSSPGFADLLPVIAVIGTHFSVVSILETGMRHAVCLEIED